MTKFAEKLLESVTTEATACTPEMSRSAHRNDGLPRRLAFIALVGSARKAPVHWEALYGRVMLQPGYRRIGGGNDQIVVTDQQGEVIKIDRASRTMTSTERLRHAQEREALFATAERYLGAFLLPQAVTIQSSPLRTRQPAVLTKQPYANILVPDLVEQDTAHTYSQLTAHGIDPQAVADQIETFCGQGREVYESEALAPDIGGRGNLVVTEEGKVVLIDSYLTNEDHRLRPSIRPGFATIEEEHRVAFLALEEKGRMLATQEIISFS